MKIGVPKEIKNNENRVGLTDSSVAELIRHGHEVIVETQAGTGSGIEDAAYQAVGATIIPSAEEVFAAAEMIVKVKEPLANERARLRAGQLLFTFLHLAPDSEQTQDLINSGATCIAYETVTAAVGGLPLLKPMSEVAGRLAPQVGAQCLLKTNGGSGTLLGGVPGVLPGKVLILGGGISGSHAAEIAIGFGADVTIADRSLDAINRLHARFGSRIKTIYSTEQSVARLAADSDLIIGAVLIPGAAAPRVVTKAMVASMRKGSVLVDIAIDQGGCFETSKPTSHAEPTYEVDGIIHYCVTNMPGAVARTSTFALNNATLPFTLALANKGWKQALTDDVHLRGGLNVESGQVTCQAVADAQNLPFVSAESILGIG